MYHGTKDEREQIFQTKVKKHLNGGRPTLKFPVVCTSYEMVLRDQHNLSKVSWEFIIIVSDFSQISFSSGLFSNICSGRRSPYEER